MNAYPAELIQHHYACMLVSGLLPSQSQIASPEPVNIPRIDTSGHESKPSSTAAASSQQDGVLLNSATTPESVPQATSSKTPTPAQAFPQVTKDLCEILSSRGRSSAWDPSKSQSAVFHTVLVDNNVRLPPKKTRPTPRTLNATAVDQQSSLASLQSRSPLSPLHPSSPLFPDGLIAPIWLRKHRELVPSVFVSFYCLKEQQSESVKDESVAQNGILSGIELKKRDEDLIRVISDRKRALNERGIKFTVVLLTTRTMLESPSLESRLSFIRRSSQLDSRASLFVLTPVSRVELGEFVTSLQTALYDSALDYYREHYRRAKKKRSRYPPPASTVTQIMNAAAEIRGSPIKDNPLSKEGWLARSDYKMGTFAELTSNLIEALTHYITAYQALVNELLASTMLLPPRTKRWAEAKVLSDCLNFKICKIHLYRNDGDGAWEQFKTHLKRFTELSQGWGIGEMTLEFWSWLGKQYRLMGDLLDLATRDVPSSPLPSFKLPLHFPDMPTFLLHPSHLPTPTVNGYSVPSHNPQHGSLVIPNELALNAHAIPADMCQGAGACFYLAGLCAMERWQRFRKMVWEEENDMNKKENAAWASLAQEKKVDHAAQVIEVFTRAHEVFKRFKLERQSLLVASKIAIAYVEGDQHEMALRFLERIVKTYRADGWPLQSVSLLLLSLRCAQRTKIVESEGRALWSIMSLQCPVTEAQRLAALSALQAWQKTSSVEGAKTVIVESNGSDGIFQVEVAFAREQINLDEQGSLFQIRMTIPLGYSLPDIHFESLAIYFTGNATTFIIEHDENNEQGSKVSLVEMSTISLNTEEDRQIVGKADLRWWSEGTVRALQGLVIPNKTGVVQVDKVCLQGKGASPFSLEFHLTKTEETTSDSIQPRWMIKADPLIFVDLNHREDRDGILVNKRSHEVRVDVLHLKEAYLEEAFAVELSIHNEESFELQCLVEATVEPNIGEVCHDLVWLREGETTQAGKLEETEVGILQAGTNGVYTLFVKCQQSLRTREVVICVKTIIPGDYTEGRTDETVRTINIPVKPLFVPAFHANWTVVRDSSLALPPLLARKPSITISDVDDGGSEGGGSEITVSTQIDGESRSMSSIAAINVGLAVLAKEGILINSVKLLLDESSKHLRYSDKAGVFDDDGSDLVDQVWSSGDRWGTVYDIEVLSEAVTGFAIEGDDGSLRPTGQLCIDWKRQASEQVHTSLLDIPLLLPPTLLTRIIVSIPSSTLLEQPLVMLLSLVNPCKLPTDIFIVIDDADSDFGVLSHKSFSVPLIAKSTRSVPVHVLSKSPSSKQVGVASATPQGIRQLPKIRAWQRDRRVKKDADGAEDARATSDIVAIMNQQRGGGIPLDVQLRYSRATSSQQQQGATSHRTSIAQLQAETQKTGIWTIFAHSQADLAK